MWSVLAATAIGTLFSVVTENSPHINRRWAATSSTRLAEYDMEGPSFIEKIHSLSDVELAALLSLVANQHCIIRTDEDSLDILEQELQLAASNVFGLNHASLTCSSTTTLDDFGNAILIGETSSIHPTPQARTPGALEVHDSYFPSRAASSLFQSSRSQFADGYTDNRKIANVIIAKNLNLASPRIQIQALELMRTKRIFTHTAVHAAPKRFLFIALLSDGNPDVPLVSHLNDHIFISHYHSVDDGFPNVEEVDGGDAESITSVVIRSPGEESKDQNNREPLINPKDIEDIIALSQKVVYSAEVKGYVQHIVTFLRLHRAVACGVSAHATKHFDLLVRCLSPLHGISYVTPSLAALAAKKIYPHRIILVTPDTERSMQWGSDRETVAAMLEGVTPEDIIDEVLGMVEVPL